jgi:hypothetical protein
MHLSVSAGVNVIAVIPGLSRDLPPRIAKLFCDKKTGSALLGIPGQARDDAHSFGFGMRGAAA